MKGRSTVKKIVAIFTSVMLMICMAVPAFAGFSVGANPYDTLLATVSTGEYLSPTTNKQYDFPMNRYKTEDGGYVYYHDLFNTAGIGASAKDSGTGIQDVFDAGKFDELKQSHKKKFLTDVFTLVNAVCYDGDKGNLVCDLDKMPTTETGIQFMNEVASQTGMASTMLSTILAHTHPDYLTANRIYEPFSGVIGTILGLLSILIMAFLGVTMGLDIAYITIPAVQMAFGSDEGGGQDGKGGFKGSKLISAEAHAAVKAADGGGGQGGSGEYKAAVGIYFKYRWKGLVMLAICLLYLVQGQIYSLIGWFLDLFGGFLGQ